MYSRVLNEKTDSNTMVSIGKSYVYVPTVKWNGKGIKWFDDNDHKKGVERK